MNGRHIANSWNFDGIVTGSPFFDRLPRTIARTAAISMSAVITSIAKNVPGISGRTFCGLMVVVIVRYAR